MNLRRRSLLLFFVLALGAWSWKLTAAEPTTFDLVKEANTFVAAPARNKITQIRSDKSDASLVPDVWFIDYLDPTAPFRCTEIKFVGGKMDSIRRPKRLFDSLSGSKQMEWKKVKVTAALALAIALKDPALKGAHLRSAQFTLTRTTNGSTWKIRFWEAKAGSPDEMIDMGEVEVSGKTGEVLKNDVHL